MEIHYGRIKSQSIKIADLLVSTIIEGPPIVATKIAVNSITVTHVTHGTV